MSPDDVDGPEDEVGTSDPSDHPDRSTGEDRPGASGDAEHGGSPTGDAHPNGGATDLPPDAPAPGRIGDAFRSRDVRTQGETIYYFGRSLVARDRLEREVWPVFNEAGYDVAHLDQTGEDVLVARRSEPGVDGIPWTHITLFVLTILSTLVAGSMWFYVEPTSEPLEIWRGWPFAVGILTVLGVHELGHYAMTRYHGVEASLPYFIPVPTLIGTMGAVIKMKGRMPHRRALFDIGVAGPLAGLVAAVVVTVIGLHLDPVTAPADRMQQEGVYEIEIGFPPLLEFLAWITGQPLYYGDPLTAVHPLVIAGWVGMLVTFLNLIPVGQLDGGHIVRSVFPRYQETVAAVVPALLYGLAVYLFVIAGVAPWNVLLWVVWGTVALGVAFAGSVTPVDDETELGTRRRFLGIATFVLGLACFAPVPIAIAL